MLVRRLVAFAATALAIRTPPARPQDSVATSPSSAVFLRSHALIRLQTTSNQWVTGRVIAFQGSIVSLQSKNGPPSDVSIDSVRRAWRSRSSGGAGAIVGGVTFGALGGFLADFAYALGACSCRVGNDCSNCSELRTVIRGVAVSGVIGVAVGGAIGGFVQHWEPVYASPSTLLRESGRVATANEAFALLEPREPTRVSMVDGRQLAGRYMRTAGNGVQLQSPWGSPTTLTVDSVTQVWIRHGNQAVMGSVLGALVGAAMGWSMSSCDASRRPCDPMRNILWGGVLGLPVGAVAGALTPGWRQVFSRGATP